MAIKHIIITTDTNTLERVKYIRIEKLNELYEYLRRAYKKRRITTPAEITKGLMFYHAANEMEAKVITAASHKLKPLDVEIILLKLIRPMLLSNAKLRNRIFNI